MILGAPDTGKSTLCRYLVYRAFAAGQQAALVDLDLGQSHLGPPATMGLGLFPPRRPGDEALHPDELYFIGQTSPVGSIMEVAVGCRVLVDAARSRGCARIVVNTSGLVDGPGAVRLKRAQAELLRPAELLALQRAQELEPLLRGLGGVGAAGETGRDPTPPRESGGWPLRVLPVSSRAARKSPAERRTYREARFRHYFRDARRLDLPWRRLVWEGLPWGRGEPLEPAALELCRRGLGVPVLYGESQGRRAFLLVAAPPAARSREMLAGQGAWEQVYWLTWPSLHWRLLGLLDGQRRTLGLGLIIPGAWHQEGLTLWSPMPPTARSLIRFVKAGRMKVDLQGQERNHV
jgi:polynucleotide 5'-hydroxyl-kinase GRC3/NOL9